MAAAAHTMSTNAVFPRSHVGFDSITAQIERKLLKRGFQFNVICVGAYAVPMLYLVNKLTSRTNGTGEVDINKHHLRVSFD